MLACGQGGAIFLALSNAYNNTERELSLFNLFLTRIYLETVCKWTAEDLEQKGK